MRPVSQIQPSILPGFPHAPERAVRAVATPTPSLWPTSRHDRPSALNAATVAMKITGHRTRSVFDRYDITSEADVREGLGRVSGSIRRAIEKTGSA